MQTVKEIWISYAKACVPKKAPLEQVRQTRLAFYAAFTAGMMSALEAATTTNNDKEATTIINGLFAEIEQFRQDVLEGKK
jgi:hypothetical protein